MDGGDGRQGETELDGRPRKVDNRGDGRRGSAMQAPSRSWAAGRVGK